MTEETLRRIIRGEVREIVREELVPIREEMRAGFARITEALTFLASCWPGTMPGRKSHVAREVEKILSADRLPAPEFVTSEVVDP